MTWIDVVDSAVKIGLGALIAGVFSFITTRVTYERGARSEYARRRRDMLEKVIEMLNGFDKIYRHQKALYDTFCLKNSPEEREPIKTEFEGLDEQLRVAFERFADASGVLLILGEIEAETALDAYQEAANDWYETELPETGESLSPILAELAELKDKVIFRRRVLMEKLARAYKTL
jgi:hypothetical protein